MKIIIGEGENQKIVETKYNIGDIVTVRDPLRRIMPERTKYRPKWRDSEEMDLINMLVYPVEVDTRYTITDINVSFASGHYKYSIEYHNDRVIFHSACRKVKEDEIIKKVDADDYESTEDVMHFIHYLANK